MIVQSILCCTECKNPNHVVSKLKHNVTIFYFLQELEDQLKTKEIELEKIEQTGFSLIQNKKEEVCVAVMDTLQKLNNSWANLDHQVSEKECKKKNLP